MFRRKGETETATRGPAESAEDFMLGQGKSGLGIKGVFLFSYESEIRLSHRNLLTELEFHGPDFTLCVLVRTDQQMEASVMVDG